MSSSTVGVQVMLEHQLPQHRGRLRAVAAQHPDAVHGDFKRGPAGVFRRIAAGGAERGGALVPHIQPGAVGGEVLDRVGSGPKHRAVQRGIAVHVPRVDVAAEGHREAEGLQRVRVRAVVLVRIDHPDAGREHHGRGAIGVHREGVGAMVGEQLHHARVAALRRHEKRRGAERELAAKAVLPALRVAGIDRGAVLQQHLRQLEAGHAAGRHGMRELADVQRAHTDQLVQRGEPDAVGVDVRAAFGEQCGQLEMRVGDRQREQRHPLRCRVLEARARIEQDLCRLDPTRLHRELHGRERVDAGRDTLVAVIDAGAVAIAQRQRWPARHSLDVGARPDERADDIGVAFRRRPHERGLVARLLVRVHVRAVRQQRAHRANPAGPRRRHQGRLATRERRVGIDAARQQALDNGGMPVGRGERQRRHAEMVGGGCDSPRAEQQVDGREVALMRRPVQCGRPVRLRRVHVDLLLQQRADRLQVPRLDRLGQRPGATRGGSGDRQEQQGNGDARWKHVHRLLQTSASRPVLSPRLPRCTSSLSRRLRQKFMNGVSNFARRCRPGFNRPPPEPTRTFGRLCGLCMLPSPMPPPASSSELSSSEPSPSGVAAMRDTRCENSCMW